MNTGTGITIPAAATLSGATTSFPEQSTQAITSEIPTPLSTTVQESTTADTTIAPSTQITTGEKHLQAMQYFFISPENHQSMFFFIVINPYTCNTVTAYNN